MRSTIPKKILVRGPNWLGDAVMCEPAIRGLRSATPEAAISLLVKPSVAELFKGHPSIDRIVPYEDKGRHAGLIGKWSLAQELRGADFDCAVLFQNAFEAALLAFTAGIPRRYGYATDGRGFLLSEAVAVPDRRAFVHQVDYYWNMLKPLGLTGKPPAPEMRLSRAEETAMEERLASLGVPMNELVIGLNPGSTYGAAKRWLPERFSEVADRLSQTLSVSEGRVVSLVIVGAKGEEPLGREIAGRLSARSTVLSGKTTIRELMAVLKRCVLLLTNDTGPMHIASALGVPVVAVFGPTDFRTTSPFGMMHAVVRQPVDCAPCLLRECPIDHRCMTRISVDQVYDTATEILRQLGRSGPKGEQAGDQTSHEGSLSAHTLPCSSSLAPLDGVTVFLDRDGTINYDSGFVKSSAELKLLPGAPEGLARLKAAGARLVVLTNQSGVGRGFFSLKDLELIHERLQGLLEQEGAALDAIYFCPHRPDDDCLCRKPRRGMVDRAATDLQLDLNRSYLIGDHVRDIQLARAVGAKPILVTTEPVTGSAWNMLEAEGAVPDRVVKSVAEAADWILEDVISLPKQP